jgi:drug/metabolite transporter (DMT)-like permease
LIIVASAWVFVTIPLLADPPDSVSMNAVALFAVSGLFAPAIARSAALAGVKALGPSVSVPIQQGLRPVIVLPLAALALGETFGPLRVLGVLAIVAGGWTLSRERGVAASDGALDALVMETDSTASGSSTRTDVRKGATAVTRGYRRGVVYPVVAAFAYSTSDLLVKSGLDGSSETSYGPPVSIGTGLLLWAIAHLLPSVRRRFEVGRDVGWLVLSGALMGSAILFLFHALDRADVSLVAPLVATQPLFVLLLSALILRHLERRERSTVLASLVVVGGTILVSL